MERDFAILDSQPTPLGELTLRRRRLLSLDGREVFEVKLGAAFLMSSLFHDVEDALATRALATLPEPALDIIVGGLGLGYTAAAALQDSRVRCCTVIEALAPVIQWHRQGLVPLGATLTGDPRCRFVHADFFEAVETGFTTGGRVHAVLLDIDHSPRHWLHPRHAAFYQPASLRRLADQLHPGGVFAMWSDDPPDRDFEQTLRRVFATVTAEVVPFANPLLGRQSASTVYLARGTTTDRLIPP